MKKIINANFSNFSWMQVAKHTALLLVILAFSTKLNAQNITATGTVVDASGQPMIGTSVMVKGANKGTVTDINGHFSLQAPVDATLIFQYVGYLNQEAKAGQNMNITMKEDALSMDAVLVTGFGSQAKRDISGAISSISDQAIAQRAPVSVYDALQGQAAGVQVMSSSAAPGGGSSIRIRGTSAMTDNGVSPLFIVDGMAVDNIDALNPNDIKSFEILKDASSAAIYGSRSANGVVIITTKSGEAGKPRFTINYLNSYSSLSHKLPQSNAFERRIFERRSNVGVSTTNNDSTSIARNSDNDYQALLTRIAPRHQIDLNLNGGTEQLRYFNSVQFYDEQGIVLNSWLKRITTRFNIDYTPNNRFTLASRTSFGYTSRNVLNEGKVLQQALQRPPHFILYFPDGTYAYDIAGRKNPIAEAYLRKDERSLYTASLLESADYKFFPWLTLHGDVSGTFNLNRKETFNSKLLETSNPPLNSGADNTTWNTYLSGTTYLTAKHSFNGKHNMEAMIGGAVEKWTALDINIGGNNYVSESVTTANSISKLDPSKVYSKKEAHSLVGFFFRGRYDYRGRYLFSGAVRRDASSRFGQQSRWGIFPSFSVAWRISDEIFLRWARPVLNDAKVRVGWGVTGNERLGNYDSYTQFVFGEYYYNGVSGVVPRDVMGNPNLKWEETKQTNFGLDLQFLKGRLNVTADYYKKRTDGLLYEAPMPLESGFKTVWLNLGSIENKGVEITVNVIPVSTRSFDWATAVTYSQNKNVIVNLPGGDKADDIWWIGQGYAAGVFYGYKYQGIYLYDESNAWTEDYRTNLVPVFKKDNYGNVIINRSKKPILDHYEMPNGTVYTGTVKQKTVDGKVSMGGDVIWAERPDENGDYKGNITSSDRMVLGNGQPTWYGSWSNTLTYKGISLFFSFYGSFGNKVYNEDFRNRTSFSNSNTTPPPFMVYNLWKYPGQYTPLYHASSTAQNNMRTGGSYFLEDGSFIRLQNVRLSYALPSRICKTLGVNLIQAYIFGNNVATWTNYKGYDPEVNQSSVLKPGKDNGQYPRKREFGLGINLKF